MAASKSSGIELAFQSKYDDREDIPGVPEHGFRVHLDHTFPVKGKPFTVPRLNQIPSFLGLSFRFMKLWYQKKKEGKRTFIDPLNDRVPCIQTYGVPLGGIGSGTIGRGFRGEFCRYQMLPGLYHWDIIHSNQFIVTLRRKGSTVYQQVLSPDRPKGSALSAWNWAFPPDQATYHGLYPRSWTLYNLPGQKVKVLCRQVSPVIPHDYKDSCLPVGAFVWTVINESDEDLEVSITLTFRDGQGRQSDSGQVSSESFTCAPPGGSSFTCAPPGGSSTWTAKGVLIRQQFRGIPCTYILGGKSNDEVKVSHQLKFDPNGSGKSLWSNLMASGNLSQEPGSESADHGGLAAAVCCQTKVKACGSSDMEMVLSWDTPKVQFGKKSKEYLRRYCRWFPSDGSAGPLLASYALAHREEWEDKIEAWQGPILQNKCLPSWYKSAIFNELYFMSDGGTVWLDEVSNQSPPSQSKDGLDTSSTNHSSSSVRHSQPSNITGAKPALGETQSKAPVEILEYGKFGYLEGHEYRMYNTYDVHFYASFALIQLWPKLQLALQYDIEHAIRRDVTTELCYLMNGKKGPTNAFGSVPHDMGDPEDEPWVNINSYPVHQTDDWKDLNIKFALQVLRDYHVTKDTTYLGHMIDAVKLVMDRALEFDTDQDGVIENSGYADQTYDAWVATGTSAYCGSLWLGAVKAYLSMLILVSRQDSPDFKKYSEILLKGSSSFDKKLWNGSYYIYDSGTSNYSDSIMSDQLCGHWYLGASGVDDSQIFPTDKVRTALRTIHTNNVCKFGGGLMGAINGCRPSGVKDTSSVQSEEFWTGVIYSLAATMMSQGLVKESFQTAYGVYHTIYERRGLGFQTPEAYFEKTHFRATGYMRPLCIWSLQWAMEQHQSQLHSGTGPTPESWLTAKGAAE